MPLSEARTTLLETLRAQPAPVTVATLVEVTGLHLNTVREHLDALHRDGLARRRRDDPHGRGRPAWLYEPTRRTSTLAAYTGLAATLAETIHRTSPTPRADATSAGDRWGHDLARDRPAPDAHDAEPAEHARRQVVELLDDLGFAPEPDAGHRRVRLTRCPLLETARAYPDVVCAVHLGVARGALAAHGADPDAARIAPFAEPGACLLDLADPATT
ncbi:helix-turn-helix transcriptional regulator [Cellulomonas sp. P22]|uniref:helix-turn-helix transcriptional regulator n=1 Tax=Cellulomonas sp. P22 TaxID=3373189 RepID=UPI00379052B2